MRKIEEAYGFDGLGLLAVKNIPGFVELRQSCLPRAWQLGQLPESTLKKYEHPASYYQFGWSRGKEKLEGRPDFSKGSFYANPTHDKPSDDPELIAKYPAFYHGNIWPSDADAPGFEASYKALAQLIVNAGTHLAAHCDAYVKSELPGYPAGLLHRIMSESRTAKARLLHYFPVGSVDSIVTAASSAVDKADDVCSSWCGWHNDHGSLTGLTSAMFHDASGGSIPCPDPEAGLYVKTRRGKLVRVVIPADYLAFQIGETSQILTGGVLQATPHCVRAAAVPGVSRSTFALFLEPEWNEPMHCPPGADPERALRGARGELLPRGVPTLESRWTPEQNFASFTEKTLASYH